jgi:glycosyltransferase involved in cell wall biosynthesis
MRIAIDASSAVVPGMTGVAKYILRLIEHLEKLDDENEYLIFYRLSRWKKREHFYLPRRVTTKVRLFQEPFFSGRGIDVFHGPDARLPRLRGPKLIATVHDLFSLVSDEFAEQKFREKKIARYRDIAERADCIICDSRSTRDDFVRFFPEAEPRTRVIHLGVDDRFCPRPGAEVERVREKYGIRSDYVLYVGTLSKRKNLLRMFDAFRRVRDRLGKDLQFVAAGRLTYGKEEVLEYVRNNRCGDHILLPGYIAEEDLPALYTGARLFLFTTLYEGFGLPILEALACGAPVVTSNVSAMLETGGGAVTTADPHETNDIEMKVLDCLSDPKMESVSRESLIEPQRDTSWDRTARMTRECYAELF